MQLGRFLEVGITTANIAESLAFYESLGFVQASVGEALPYPYAVITDGRICLGLHERDEPVDAALTWVLPELAHHIDELEALGVTLDYARIDEASLNTAGFVDPSGQRVNIVEARTFSPPSLAASFASELGYFEEFAIPTPDTTESARFWEKLGFIAFEPVTTPFEKIVVMGRDLNVGLYGLDLAGPALVFSDPDMKTRIAALRERNHVFAKRLPRGLTAADGAILQAPEGTLLLLLTGNADAGPPDAAGFELQEAPRD
jgi:catechol 2,3-dioxygenase-like lactoylglutathione lyase family enzyme